MPFAELLDKEKQLFRHHRMEASLEIPIGVPSWLLKDFSGMLQCPGGETFGLKLSLSPPLQHFTILSEFTRSSIPLSRRSELWHKLNLLILECKAM
jgi:hypothetical protein